MDTLQRCQASIVSNAYAQSPEPLAAPHLFQRRQVTVKTAPDASA